MKIAPGGTPTSADKRAPETTRSAELQSLMICTLIETRQVMVVFTRFEAPSSQMD